MGVVGEQLLLAVALYGGDFRKLAHRAQVEWVEIAAELIEAHRPSERVVLPNDAKVVDGGMGPDEAGTGDGTLELPYGSGSSSAA